MKVQRYEKIPIYACLKIFFVILHDKLEINLYHKWDFYTPDWPNMTFPRK